MIATPDEYYRVFQAAVGDPSNTNVTAYGEVSTPRELVCDMLDALPSHVWLNSKLKWYEPACGLAPFLYEVYQRLMVSLQSELPDEASRCRHIVEEMLIFNEIQAKNITLVKQLFRADRYHLNLIEGCFFKAAVNADVVVGNPPYNKIGTKNSGNAEWMKFVRTVLTTPLLNPGGWLVFVHPAGWRKPESELSKNKGLVSLMTHEHQMLHLEMYDAASGKKVFKCGTNYDWYVIENLPAYTTTTVRDTQGQQYTLDLLMWSWLPNYGFAQLTPLLATTGEARCPVIYSRSAYASDKAWVSAVEGGEFIHPVVKTTPAAGVRYLYSNTDSKGMYGVSKVIFGDSNFDHPIIDMEGKYATGENAMSIQVESLAEAEELKTALQTPMVRDLLRNACLWGNFRLDWRLFTFLKARFWQLLLPDRVVSLDSPIH